MSVLIHTMFKLIAKSVLLLKGNKYFLKKNYQKYRRNRTYSWKIFRNLSTKDVISW